MIFIKSSFMKIIVTGGCGFVGSHLIEHLIEKNHYPIVVDNCISGDYNKIKHYVKQKKLKFFKYDIRDLSKLMKLPKADAVIHLAAVASVVESINNPLYVNDVNVNGTLNILEFCKIKKIRKLVFTSSAAIFGEYERKISENTVAIPTTIYGASKLVGEQYCRIYSKLYGIKIVVFRPFNIYGSGQNLAYAGVISKFLERIRMGENPIIFGDGNQTRDFIHVKDLIRFFELGISKKFNDKFQIYNLATGKSTTINNLAKIIIKLTKNKKVKPIYKNPISGIVVFSTANIKKIKKEFGISPEITLETGLSELVSNY